MPSSYYKTGSLRRQALLLPARIEDYVGRNNAVRAIEAYVASLDLAKLRFRPEIRKNLLPTAAGAILVRR